MTTRHKGYIVALDKDIREDDALAIISALHMIKGVIAVTPIEANADDVILRLRIKQEVREKIFELIDAVDNLG